MTEQLIINNKAVWIVVEPLEIREAVAHGAPAEYFIAFYHLQQPEQTSGELFRDDNHRAKIFDSPLQALEYASEKLLETF